MQNTYATAILAQKAFAKIVQNKKLKTLRVLVSFCNNSHITQRSAVYATGDICNVTDAPEQRAKAINNALAAAKQQLLTNNIVIVN